MRRLAVPLALLLAALQPLMAQAATQPLQSVYIKLSDLKSFHPAGPNNGPDVPLMFSYMSYGRYDSKMGAGRYLCYPPQRDAKLGWKRGRGAGY